MCDFEEFYVKCVINRSGRNFYQNISMQLSQAPVAYLAPEIPALSATFVYEEILGLERLGLCVIPFSVRAPTVFASEQSALANRVTILYGASPICLALKAVCLLPAFGLRSVRALHCLIADMWEVGLHRLLSWKLVVQFLAGARLAQALKHAGCAHLHIHFAHVPAQIGMYASMFSGVPFTVTAHANDIFERGLLLARKAARAKHFLTISEFNIRYLQTQGISADQLGVVRCGVSLVADLFQKRAVNRDGVTRIGSLGRLVEKKGFDVLIRAAALLKQRGHTIELRIAGDGPLKAELVALSSSLGVADITVFEGSLPHSKVKAWMNGLDVFALACKQDQAGDMDGIPVVLMEAMSQGLAVVSTDLSGIPELIIHGETGLLARANDAEDFAGQLERLFKAELDMSDITHNAFTHVQSEFSQTVNLNRLLGYFWSPVSLKP
jgi:colanic acid/amylovoran biosynthesis glycosyltransferase